MLLLTAPLQVLAADMVIPPFLLLGLWLIGSPLLILGWLASALWRKRRSAALVALISGVYFAVFAVLLQPAWRGLTNLTYHLVFLTRASALSKIVADVEAGRITPSNLVLGAEQISGSSPQFFIDRGPPMRVAFPFIPYGHQFAMIYDPSDLLADAPGEYDQQPKFTFTHQAAKIFNGKIGWCTPLDRHYFWCSLTR
jgi:hypothetical protein